MQPVKPVLPARVKCLLARIHILARVAMRAGFSGVELADMLVGAYTLRSNAFLLVPPTPPGNLNLNRTESMNWITGLGIALALAMDAFAVSIASGLKLAGVTPRHVFRLSFHFGLFQFLMPVIGWYIGRQMAAAISEFDHWIAFGLLSLVGGRMLWEAYSERESGAKTDPTRGVLLVALSLATSIDAPWRE